MPYVLRLDSSAWGESSHTRELADFFQQTWLQKYPDDQITVRDVTQPMVPHVDEVVLKGFQTPVEARTEAMREAVDFAMTLIAELKQADVLLISAPMYNLTIPSSLKAWVDQIVRAGETFAMDDKGNFWGLLTTPAAFVLSTCGGQGYQDGGPMAKLNFVEPYMQELLGFLGVKDIQFFMAEGMMAGPEERATTVAHTKSKIQMAIETTQLIS